MSQHVMDYSTQAIVVVDVTIIGIEPRAIVSPVKPRGTAACSPFAVFALLLQLITLELFVATVFYDNDFHIAVAKERVVQHFPLYMDRHAGTRLRKNHYFIKILKIKVFQAKHQGMMLLLA